MQEFPACRRTVLRGAALAGVAGVGLTACGSDSTSTATGSATTTAGAATTSAAASSGTSGTELGAASDVPVGGATLYKDAKLVVSQPTEGTYKAFSAVCTHQGCVCDKVEDTKLVCSCHNSVFNTETGAAESGPATQALAAASVTVQDGKLVAG